jgi:hypothetical protein
VWDRWHSICGALATARPMSTTTVNRPAGGSWTQHGRSKVPRDARTVRCQLH